MVKFETRVISDREYLKVCPSDEVFERKGTRIQYDEDEDMQVAIFRISGKLYCLWNICPHRHKDQIYNGIIKDLKVICPEHGWTYSLETGENVNKRQGMRGLDKFDVFEEDGWVYIEKPNISIPKWRQDNFNERL